jgi:AcrR family transcriptional regulator
VDENEPDEQDDIPLPFRNYQRPRPDRGTFPDRPNRPDRPDRHDRPDRLGKPPQPDRHDRPSRPELRRAEHLQRTRERGGRPPGRDRGLSRAEIVRAAVAVADAEGPEAISMRRIARELRAGAMSLYWYVGSKEELLDLMLESLEAEISLPQPTSDWRTDLAELARRQRAVLLRHQWAMEFMGGRPPTGPNDVRNLERMLAMVAGLGLDAQTSIDVLMTVVTYTLGAALREVQEIRADQIRAEMEAEMTPEEIEAEQARFHGWFETNNDFPNVSRMVAEDVDPDSPDTREDRFEFGLACLLDGIAVRVSHPQK